MDQQLIYTASTWVVPAVLAITLHEAAHGFGARWFGDLPLSGLQLGTNLNVIGWRPSRPVEWVIGTILRLTGNG